MKQVFWMAAVCVGSWLAAAWLAGRPSELFLGMAGPLVAASVTWLAVDRAHRRHPSAVTRVLMAALGLKMLFFGVYVVAVSRIEDVDLMAFGASFVSYFVALYIVQAFLIRGLAARPAA